MLRLSDHLTDSDVKRLDSWPVVHQGERNAPAKFRLQQALKSVSIEVMAWCPECCEREAAISHIEHAFKCANAALDKEPGTAGEDVSSKRSS